MRALPLLAFALATACTAEPMPCDPASPTCVEPTWASIHSVIITDTCAVEFCHGDPDGNNEADLDLRGLTESYDRVGQISTSDDCGMLGLRLVEPGDPDRSLLYAKLFAVDAEMDTAICGFRMPYAGGQLPTQWTDAVRAWIEDGAPAP